MTEQLPEYELFAIRYATRQAQRVDHFIGGDPHDGPMPMDYFVWVAKSPERAFVIDCGFTAETAQKRKRNFLRDPLRHPLRHPRGAARGSFHRRRSARRPDADGLFRV